MRIYHPVTSDTFLPEVPLEVLEGFPSRPFAFMIAVYVLGEYLQSNDVKHYVVHQLMYGVRDIPEAADLAEAAELLATNTTEDTGKILRKWVLDTASLDNEGSKRDKPPALAAAAKDFSGLIECITAEARENAIKLQELMASEHQLRS